MDTNVLAYAFGATDDPRQLRASALLRDLRRSDAVVVSAQVLSELYVVLTRKLSPPLPAAVARTAVQIAARWEVVALDASLVQGAIDRANAHRVSHWDALIVEAAVRAGCDRLWTEDLHDGAVFDGVRVVNPFRS